MAVTTVDAYMTSLREKAATVDYVDKFYLRPRQGIGGHIVVASVAD